MTLKPNPDNPRLHHPCPKCLAEPGYPCRAYSRNLGAYTDTYTLHAARPLDPGLERKPGSVTPTPIGNRTISNWPPGEFIDITEPEHGVQVEVREDGTVLWVNVDGICVLRVCRIPYLKIEDKRTVKGVRRVDNNRGRVKTTRAGDAVLPKDA